MQKKYLNNTIFLGPVILQVSLQEAVILQKSMCSCWFKRFKLAFVFCLTHGFDTCLFFSFPLYSALHWFGKKMQNKLHPKNMFERTQAFNRHMWGIGVKLSLRNWYPKHDRFNYSLVRCMNETPGSNRRHVQCFSASVLARNIRSCLNMFCFEISGFSYLEKT